jgi:hypothetical protein
MDELQRELFEILLHRDWAHGAETAIDGAQLGHFYERYADHAGQQVVYVATGKTSQPPSVGWASGIYACVSQSRRAARQVTVQVMRLRR